MSSNYIINFVDENGNNFDTVSGKPARFLMKHSELLRTLHEIDPTARTFTIPITMPYGRREVFTKILKGFPVGEWRVDDYGDEVAWFKPVSEEEEAIIADVVARGNTTVQDERKQAVHDILSFLMMDPGAEERMITIQYPKNNNAREMFRRRNITQKRRNNTFKKLAQNAYHNTNVNYLEEQANEKTRPFLNEDTIEDLIEKHKDLLYGILRPRYSSTVRLNKLMNEKDIAKRDKAWEAHKEHRRKQRNTRRRQMNFDNNNYNNFNSNNNNNDYYNVELLEEYFKPFPVDVSKMSSREFERYLRSLRREGEEKHLPYQGPLVGNLFGNQSNV